jgi:topoisomerase-4 subunit A
MVVYLNVDEVIQTIRESDEPRAALMQRFDLTERQAEDILEMRLRQLARLEGFKIEKELTSQREEQASLQELLDNSSAFKRMMIREIEADAKHYGDDRRTLIEAAERAVLETRVVDEPVTVVISQKGWLRSRQGHGHDPAQFSFKAGDNLYDAIECRSTDDLIAISSTGRVYTVAVASLPSARGDGQPITAMIDLEAGASIVHMVAGPKEQRYLLGVQQGYGFITRASDMASRLKAGKQFITLEKDDILFKPLALQPDDTHIAFLSRKERFLVVEMSELKVLGAGGRGTILMGLDAGDVIVQCAPVGSQGMQARGIYRNRDTVQSLSLDDLSQYIGKRARKGRQFGLKLRQLTLDRL